MTMEEIILEDYKYHDMEELKEHVETLHENKFHKRKPTWEQELLQDVERYDASDGMHR